MYKNTKKWIILCLYSLIIFALGFLTMIISKNIVAAASTAAVAATFIYFVQKPYLGILTLLASIAFVPYIPVSSFGFSLDDIAFLAIILLGSIYLIKNRDKIKNTSLVVPFLVLAATGISSAIYNALSFTNFFSLLAKGSIRIALTLLFIIIIQNLIDNKEKIYKLFYILIGASVLESIFGIISFIFQYQSPYNIGVAATRDYSVLSNIVGGRVNGTFGSVLPNFTGGNLLASYLILFIPITIALLLISKKSSAKIFFAIAAILQSLCLVLTYSRSSIIFVVISLFIMTILLKKWKLTAGISSAALLFFFFTPGLQARFFYDKTDRLDIWRSAYLVARDHFWFGVGPGNYLQELSSKLIHYRVFTFYTEVLTPHNSLLYTWATMGFLATLAFIWLIAAFLKQYWNSYKSALTNSELILNAALFASCIGFLLQNVTNNFFFVPTVCLYFWTITAILPNLNKKTYER